MKVWLRVIFRVPCETISNNAGVEGRATVENILSGAAGYDAHTDQYVDMIQAGIVDPTKVIKQVMTSLIDESLWVILGTVGRIWCRLFAYYCRMCHYWRTSSTICRWNASRRNGRHGRNGWNDVNMTHIRFNRWLIGRWPIGMTNTLFRNGFWGVGRFRVRWPRESVGQIRLPNTWLTD